MILARIRLERQPELPGLADAGRPLRDLERLVDEDFLRELQPALEEARRARSACASNGAAGAARSRRVSRPAGPATASPPGASPR